MSINKKISEFDIIEEFDITTKIPIIQGSPLKNGIITPEDFTKSIADDILIELNLDDVDNTSDIDKPISTATKTYVDNKVKTDVPVDAKFTDTNTITSINGKTGVISKADIVALGIPAQDTIVDISGKADKTYVDNKVKTNVPLGAIFTDTNTITTVNGKTGVITKGDIVALGIPTKDTKTTINGKTGVISKSDIVALGIPAQDTIVDISGKADKTYVDNKVKTDVPLGAKFTDTVYTGGDNVKIVGTTISLTGELGLTEAQIKAVKVDNASNADKVNGKTVLSNVPLDAKFTDTIVNISGKADKTYVDNKVKTNVPVDAKFTDTIVDISGKADKTYVDEQIDIINDKHIPMITLTEDEYDELLTKDPNTFYFIKED